MPEKPLLCLGETWLELTADTPPELAGQFQVTGIPMLVMFKNGKAVDAKVGYRA